MKIGWPPYVVKFVSPSAHLWQCHEIETWHIGQSVPVDCPFGFRFFMWLNLKPGLSDKLNYSVTLYQQVLCAAAAAAMFGAI